MGQDRRNGVMRSGQFIDRFSRQMISVLMNRVWVESEGGESKIIVTLGGEGRAKMYGAPPAMYSVSSQNKA